MIASVTYTGRWVRLTLSPESEREHVIMLLLESRPVPPFSVDSAGDVETVIELVPA